MKESSHNIFLFSNLFSLVISFYFTTLFKFFNFHLLSIIWSFLLVLSHCVLNYLKKQRRFLIFELLKLKKKKVKYNLYMC
jgi:hypothetical protein